MPKFEAVILDIDGTLSPQISWYALTEGMGGSTEQHRAIFESFKLGSINYEIAKQQLIDLWQSTGNAKRSYIQDIFANWQLYPGVEQTVREIKESGYRTCIISGTFDIWAEEIARRLAIDDYYANTELVWDDNGNLIDMHYDLMQGEKKLKQFKSLCKKYELNPKQCLTTGNSDNDIGLFELTGKGVVVGQDIDEGLASKAWRRVEKFSDIKQFLNLGNSSLGQSK